MFTHGSLIEACKNLGLDPEKIGDRSLVNGHPMNTFCTPFDLTSINFPEKELVEVVKIGKITWNIVSKISLNMYYDSSLESERALYINKNTERILPVLIDSLNFWLKQGMEKCKSTKDLVTHNGSIYEVDPEYQKSMNKFSEEMEEVDIDYRKKLHASQK